MCIVKPEHYMDGYSNEIRICTEHIKLQQWRVSNTCCLSVLRSYIKWHSTSKMHYDSYRSMVTECHIQIYDRRCHGWHPVLCLSFSASIEPRPTDDPFEMTSHWLSSMMMMANAWLCVLLVSNEQRLCVFHVLCRCNLNKWVDWFDEIQSIVAKHCLR